MMRTGTKAWIGLLAIGVVSARADDFGDILKKAAGNVVREQFSEKKFEQNAAQRENGKVYTTKTQDGWILVAHRFPPKTAPRAGASPIILCHGLTYNALFWNLEPAASLPEYLSALGYDVWVVDLRGSGLSSKWVWKIDDLPSQLVGDAFLRLSKGKAAPVGHASIDAKFANWSLDHHIYYDVPALVDLVRRQTKAADVTWVGHSMGGIVAIAHLARFGNPGIGRLVTVGSQVTMPNGQILVQFATEMIRTRSGQIEGRLEGKQLVKESKTSVDNLFFNESNASPKVYEALSGWAKDIPAIGLMQQYRALAETGELWDMKKKFNYAKAIDKITIPVLFTCGSGDQFAPPGVQKYLYDHVGSSDKTAIVFGRARGFSVDSGHDDTLVGLKSRAEVYPVIERWIAGARLPAASAAAPPRTPTQVR